MSTIKTIYTLNAVNMAALTLTQIVTVPLFLHYLGVRGYEEWVFISAIGFACLIFDFGLVAYNSNTARIAYSHNDAETAQSAIGHGLTFFLFFLGIFAVAAAVILATPYGKNNFALALVILHVPFSQFRTWLSYIFTARISQAGELLSFITNTILQTAAYVIVVVNGGDVTSLALAQLFSTVFLGIAPIIVALRAYAPEIIYRPRLIARDKVGDFAKGCFGNFGYSAVNVVVVHFPVILLGLIPSLPAGTLAIFTTSRTLTGIVRQFCQQLARSNVIEISRHLAPEHRPRMQYLFLTGSAIIAALAGIGMGGLWPVADLVLKIWTGKPELYDPVVIGLFCIGATMSAQLQLPMILPQFTNRAAMMAGPLFAQVTLLVMLGLPAGYFLGAAGMVLALSVAEISTLGFVSLRRIVPETGLTAARFLLMTGLPASALFIVSACISEISRNTFHADSFYGLAKTGLMWAVLISPVLWVSYKMAKRNQWHS